MASHKTPPVDDGYESGESVSTLRRLCGGKRLKVCLADVTYPDDHDEDSDWECDAKVKPVDAVLHALTVGSNVSQPESWECRICSNLNPWQAASCSICCCEYGCYRDGQHFFYSDGAIHVDDDEDEDEEEEDEGHQHHGEVIDVSDGDSSVEFVGIVPMSTSRKLKSKSGSKSWPPHAKNVCSPSSRGLIRSVDGSE